MKKAKKMTQIKLALLWLKKHTTLVLLIIISILAVFISLLFFWLKIKGFRVSDLLFHLQMKKKEGDVKDLNTKKEIIKNDTKHSQKELDEIDEEIKEIKKEAMIKRSEIKDLTNEQLAARFNNLFSQNQSD